MAPGTEFARDFCVGIGPLQLGVVLVSFIFRPSQSLYCSVRNIPYHYNANSHNDMLMG